MPASGIWTAATILQTRKKPNLRVNRSLRTTETERWKKPVSLMIHIIVPLSQPILLPALLLTWDYVLPLLLRSIWVGVFCFVQKVSKQDISIWQYHSFLYLWNGLGMELGLLTLAQQTLTILDMGWYSVLIDNTGMVTWNSPRGKHTRNHNEEMALRHGYRMVSLSVVSLYV